MSDRDSFVSRRELLAAGTSLAALSAAACSATGATAAPRTALADAPTAPFDNFRDYIKALEAHDLLLRFPRADQDAYETTALVFRAADEFGMYSTPAVMFDEVKIDGRWVKGPVIGNHQGHWYTDAIVWGLPVTKGDPHGTFRRAKAHMHEMIAANGGSYPQIPPVTVGRERALCKEVVLKGDAIDITKFAFLKTNPSDAGRYVNTGSVFMDDPELGPNFGTYRCQIKGPRQLGVNPEPNQTGWKMLKAAQARGEKFAKVAIVLGQDPVTWMISGTRVAPRFSGKPVDELALAGGMRGKPLEVVKCEDSDMLVPAHAEMVIEGDVPLDAKLLPEGPFGEMFGYLGPAKEENFWMNITSVTHRREPWLLNAYTGMQRGMITAPMDALYESFLRRSVPGLKEFYGPQDAMGVGIMSIKKTSPGEALKAGTAIASRSPINKVMIVVDDDINIYDKDAVLMAVGSRWQPHPASHVIEDSIGIITDPSQPVQGRTSKIVIDATRQWPEEGGRENFPETNRALLEQGAPGAMARVDARFGTALKDWARRHV